MTGKGSGAHLLGLGEEGWVWAGPWCGQRYRLPASCRNVQGGAFREANPLEEENSGCFYFPPDETDGEKKKNPTSRVTHDGKQQRSKKAFLLYTGSSTDK